MKKKGSVAEFGDQRNAELLEAFKRVLKTCNYRDNADYFYRAALEPASRFWVSERRALVVMKKIINGDSLDGMFAKRKAMFMEIYRRVQALREKNPKLTLFSAVFEVVNSPAPEFYLSPGSARVLIYRLRA